MEGKVSIFLQENGKSKQLLSEHNLVTRGLKRYYDLACTAGPTHDYSYTRKVGHSTEVYRYHCKTAQQFMDTSLYERDYLHPLNVRGLGGILLFDNDLPASENAYKIKPGYPHIVGYADQITDFSTLTSDLPSQLGRLSEEDSGEIENGYRLVWKWEGDQLVGATVKSLALVNDAVGGPGFGPFKCRYTRIGQRNQAWTYSYTSEYWNRWSAFVDQTSSDLSYPFYIDDNDEYVYCAAFDGTNFTISKRKVNMEPDMEGTTTFIENVSVTQLVDADYFRPTWETDPDSSLYRLHYGYNGYAYWIGREKDVSNHIYPLVKIDLENMSVIEEDMTFPFSIGDAVFNGEYCYFRDISSSNNVGICRMKLSDGTYEQNDKYVVTTDISPTIGGCYLRSGSDYIPTDFQGPMLQYYGVDPRNVDYPDDEYATEYSAYELMDLNKNSMFARCVSAQAYSGLYLNPGYLGTIFNLPTAVTKMTSGQTLVIQYDLIGDYG